MKKSLVVAAGGAVGTLTRYLIFQILIPGGAIFHPLLTMLINVSGSFILGFLIILFVKKLPVSAEIRLAVTTGFLGGYTTFSTMCKDAVMLGFSGKILFSAVYLAASVFLGLAAAWFGVKLGKRLERGRTE